MTREGLPASCPQGNKMLSQLVLSKKIDKWATVNFYMTQQLSWLTKSRLCGYWGAGHPRVLLKLQRGLIPP